MTLEGIVLGLIAIAIGAAFCFWGFRFFLLLLPVWGFIFGFIVGADAMTYIFGTGFLSEISSWVVGFVVGIIFAALSYLYYWFAIVWIGATAGYAVGTGIMAWLTPNLDLVTFIIGLALAAVFAVIFIVLKLPKFLAIGFTAFLGAFALMAGITLLLGRIPVEGLHAGGLIGFFRADTSISWLWEGAAVILGLCGFVYQWVANSGTQFVSEGDYRNPGLPASEAYMGDDNKGTRDRPM
jgi:hypothetical protein